MRIKAAVILLFLTLSTVWADVALLPNGVQQFFDNNGNPLTSGTVTTYSAGTSTLKGTFKDSLGTIPNTNPIILDAGGKAIIYGEGNYREVVKDRNGNLIWDAVTAPGGGSSTPTNVGDGNLVGTVLPWSGLVAPNQYVFAYGQEISRTTFPTFFTAVTQALNVICSIGSNTLTGLADTTQINVGAPVELPLCVIPGTTVASKTGTTVVLSNPSTVSINSIATFFPYGNGVGTTSFYVPDLRGYVLAGRDNMGGTAAARLSTPNYGSRTPDALGAPGGSQSQIVSSSQAQVNSGSTFSVNTAPNITVSVIQPTITLNYVIKVTPDSNASAASGVAAISGMTGVISCGSGLLCTGNIINVQGLSNSTLNLVSAGWGLTGGPCTITCTLSTATTNPAFQYGNPVNLQLNVATDTISNLTISLRTNDGNIPTAVNPVLIPYRNATLTSGAVTWLPLTSSLSLVLPGGARVGSGNSIPFRIWVAAANDSGTVRLCVINTLSGTDIYQLNNQGFIDTATNPPGIFSQTWYCNASFTNKPYTILGYFTYEAGLATAGTWVSIPTTIQLYGAGVKLPGEVVKSGNNIFGTQLNGTGTFTENDTVPTTANGNEFITQNLVTTSAANLFEIDWQFMGSTSAASTLTSAIFASGSANALAVSSTQIGTSARFITMQGTYRGVTSAISTFTISMRAGGTGASTTIINGVTAGSRLYGGTANSYLKVKEIMR